VKTVSTKLSKEDFEEFQEICKNNGQCMSERLRDLIKMKTNSNSDIIPKTCTNCDEEVHNTLRKISNILHDSIELEITEDDDGRPTKFTTYWDYN